MLKKVVRFPAYVCLAAGWTVIIGGVYANYVIRETKACYRKHKYKR